MNALKPAEQIGLEDDGLFLLGQFELMPTKPPMALISDYAQQRRILPVNTPFPGRWDNSKTPYSVEIMDNMSPHSPIQHTAVMKGVQLGLTAAAENVIAYFMDEFPSEILYVTATEKLLEIWAPKRLEPLIESCGFRHKIFSQQNTKGSRKTGDKMYSKEYIGGTLNMTSAQSASGLRSDSKMVLIRDEIDGAPTMLRTGEGNWLDVSEARTLAWGERRKILDITTPTTFEDSQMNEFYEYGDRRHYQVPCPLCGKRQFLEYGHDKTMYGLKADTKAGELLDAYYLCDFCHDAIFNHHKTEMLIKGRWVPTAKTSDELFRSYRLPSLYSPVGMLSWKRLFGYWLKAQDEPDGMRSFVMLYDAKPYKESGTRPKLKNVIELQGGYKEGTIPSDEILFLTAGIDVQRGSDTDPNNPPRLEVEAMGHGRKYKSWSILYRRFEGPVDNPHAGAWKKLNDFVTEEKGFEFKRKDGMVFSPVRVLIDSGDGLTHDAVYRFCEQWNNTFPSKGFGVLKRLTKDKKGQDKEDELHHSNFTRFRTSNEAPRLVTISTNYYKRNLYNNLAVRRKPIGPQDAGFCDFPRDYNEEYFQMLTAEEQITGGAFRNPSGRRNEALDCRVLCMCGGDIFIRDKTLALAVTVKQRGGTDADLAKVNHRFTLDFLANELAKRAAQIKK
jgi:phage terminase large subunit GpA-like protein